MPGISLVCDVEVVDDVLTPCCKVAALRSVATETREECFVREATSIHAGEVSQPSESVGSEYIFDWADVTAFPEWFVGDVAVCCETDAEDVADAAHLECLQASEMSSERSPCFRAVEECW